MRHIAMVLILFLSACATTSGPPVNKTKMAEGYFMRGMSHFQEKNYELASVEFNRSIQADDNYKQSYYMLGFLADQRGEYAAAVDYYKKAVSIDSGYSEAYNAMGADYVYLKKWDDAIKSFKKALDNKLYTTPHLPYFNMGRVYVTLKNYDKAIESFREAKRYADLDFIVYDLGNALLDAGKIKESINEFREGVKMEPQNANFRYSLGVALVKEGNKRAAVAEFQKAAELAPGSPIAVQAKDYIKTLR